VFVASRRVVAAVSVGENVCLYVGVRRPREGVPLVSGEHSVLGVSRAVMMVVVSAWF